jgi:tetratricopeptide (TPR) repeat protein
MGPVWALLLWFAPDPALIREVQQSIDAGRYQLALERLSSSEARDAQWYLLASRAWDGLNNPARAVEEAENALRLAPEQLPYHLNLAQIFLSRNTPEAALEIFTEAENMFPGNFLIRLGKGLARKEMQVYGEAEEDLGWCLDRQPASAIAFDGLATVYLHLMRFENLIDVSTTFLKHNSTDYRGYYFLAAGRDGASLPDEETRRLLAESLKRNPGFAAAHVLMGKVLLRESRPGEALGYLKRAAELRPDLPQTHLLLVKALRLTGDEAGAERHRRLLNELNAKGREATPGLRYGRGSRTSEHP